MSQHVFHLGATAPQLATPFGARTAMRSDDFPILDRLSLARLTIEPRGFREPHWHANANELGYCLRGRLLVTVFADPNRHASFTISAGEMFFVPSGALHAIENVGPDQAELIIAFSHEQPQDFGLSGSVSMLTANVVGNTLGLAAGQLAGLRKGTDDIFAGQVDGPPELDPAAGYPDDLKLDLEGLAPRIDNQYGVLKTARLDTWPALDQLAMYSLRITGKGMREPHWHPVTAELGYLHAGRARMTVRSDDGSVDTYELGPGDAYFIPRAFPHHIENLADHEEAHFLIFFDQPEVHDIGYTGSAGALARRVLAPTLGLSAAELPELPEMPADLLIVEKRNPVDP
ncbi:MAG TPA: cupin domain-containing protein [Solirubrobacteraceae bacterium]|nr:cupin domain-containing protein [Solirubrobacteraceae bacterium]